MQRFRDELDAALSTWTPQLVIADFTLPVAGSVARARQISWWTSLPSPCVLEAPGGPPAYLGGWLPRDDAWGRLRDALGRTTVRAFKRGVGGLYRRELATLGIDNLYRPDGSEAVEFHFSHGDATRSTGLRDRNYQELAYVSYARDLPHYDLVIHHGGAGILYHCLSLGLPALVMPLDYDQFDHAARLESAGVARWLRTVRDWQQQVRSALDDRALRVRCEDYRQRLGGMSAESRVAALVSRQFDSAGAG